MPFSSLILVINCGSSSLKFSLFPDTGGTPVLSGLAERLGLDNATMTLKDVKGQKVILALNESSHICALKVLFRELAERQWLPAVRAIGHRVAHGGSEFKCSVQVTSQVIEKIHALSSLAPLHNPANLSGIEAAISLLPDVIQVAVFDTAFHQTLSPAAYTYAIPLEYQQRYQVRRYGFHGTSHRYITGEALTMLDLDPDDHGILIAHLGNGSSVCAVQNGQSVDTSMGMTPLEGLVMGTRCGDIDFGALAHIATSAGQSIDSLYKIMNNHSGLLGLSGMSSDCRTLQDARGKGDLRATLAIDVMVHRLARHLGGHMTSLKRLDALIFTGGIGENSALIRELTLERLGIFGLKINPQKNQQMCNGRSGLISSPDTPRVLVIPTNEEKMIAQDAMAICENQSLI